MALSAVRQLADSVGPSRCALRMNLLSGPRLVLSPALGADEGSQALQPAGPEPSGPEATAI
jgi:hypothetical protein